jgi:ketosteroid isomerase-like protein
MSEENVEAFKRGIDAYNRWDLESLLETCDPEIEWYPLSAEIEGGEAFHGHEGLRQWWANLNATIEELSVRLDEVRDLGDTVLALGHAHFRFKSGVSVDMEGGYLGRFRNGLSVWARQYPSRAEALEAAGLSK